MEAVRWTQYSGVLIPAMRWSESINDGRCNLRRDHAAQQPEESTPAQFHCWLLFLWLCSLRSPVRIPSARLHRNQLTIRLALKLHFRRWDLQSEDLLLQFIDAPLLLRQLAAQVFDLVNQVSAQRKQERGQPIRPVPHFAGGDVVLGHRLSMNQMNAGLAGLPSFRRTHSA